MRAIVVTPMVANSLRIKELDMPEVSKGHLLLNVQKVGICGTDRDIISGFYGAPPKGSDFLVLGHESLSRVTDIGKGVRGFKKGDLVVPTVRRKCPENCLNCRNEESDMCLTGHYKEHGIKGLHGFASDFAISDADFVVKLPESLKDVGVLLEPLTIVEKGEVQTYLLQQSRMKWAPKRALVLGAGPVGLLATAILRLRGLDVSTVATRSAESLKARLVQQTGAEYIDAKEKPLKSMEDQYDLVFEITGSPSVALEAQHLIGTNGVTCYLGIYKMEQNMEDAGKLFTDLVLGNRVHFGSVNANKTYFQRGVEDLLKIRKKWNGFLESIITRRAKIEDLENAYSPESEEEIKTIIEIRSVG
ncbi:MAG: glucose 1-dehydrogenase [archaeon]|nr:glucose 1-dehydrogenase [archaeon]